MSRPLSFDGVPYADPVSHMHRLSVLGACPSTTVFPSTSSEGSGGRSPTTTLETSAYGDCRSTPTPLVTFTGGTGAYDFIDRALHRPLPLTLVYCLHPASSSPPALADDAGHATPPHLAASTGGGGRFSSDATTAPTSAVYFTAEEIARLRALMIAFDSLLSGASTSTSSVAPLTEQDCVISMLACSIFWFSIDRFCWFCYGLFWHYETTFYTSRYIAMDSFYWSIFSYDS